MAVVYIMFYKTYLAGKNVIIFSDLKISAECPLFSHVPDIWIRVRGTAREVPSQASQVRISFLKVFFNTIYLYFNILWIIMKYASSLL